MCHTLTFESILSECIEMPKHVITTKIYFPCDEILAERAAAALHSDSHEEIDFKFEFDFSSSSEFEIDSVAVNVSAPATEAASETVTTTTSASAAGSASDSVSASAAGDCSSFSSEGTLMTPRVIPRRHCEDNDCIPLGIFGSARTKGECSRCEGLQGDEPIIMVIDSRDGIFGRLIAALTE